MFLGRMEEKKGTIKQTYETTALHKYTCRAAFLNLFLPFGHA